MRRCCVHLFGQGTEGYGFGLQIFYDRQEMWKRSPQPIQFPDNECVTTLYIRETFFKTGSVIAGFCGCRLKCKKFLILMCE